MRAIKYVSPLLHAYAGGCAPCDGMALRFRQGSGDTPRTCAFADEALVDPHANPLQADFFGHFPPIFLHADADYDVELLNAAGSVVAAHVVTGGRAAASTPDDAGTFVDLAHLSPPANVTRLRTDGWDKQGTGAADYVSDAIATPQLARSHPRFCTTTRNGRCFRLMPAGGLITVEQGGARGDPAGTGKVDDREAIQATVEYAAAIGIARVGLSKPSYSLWAPRRTTPVDRHGTDGQYIVLGANQRLHVVGLGRARAHLRFLAPGGASPDGTQAGTAFQLVAGKVWRGSGFYLPATAGIDRTRIDRKSPRQSLTLEHLVIDGATRKSGYFGIPARPSDGAGWDVTHKGVRSQADARGGDISILDCEMTGWRGETVFSTNDPSARLTVRNSSFSRSNGQGLNLNGCMVDVQDCRIADCYMGIEGWTGMEKGRLVNVEIVDCFGIPGKSGGAFMIDGGFYDHRKLQATATGPDLPASFGAPGALSALPFDRGEIALTVRNCGRGYIGSWLVGSIAATDTTLVIGDGTAAPGGSHGLDLDLTMTTDKTDQSYLIIACRQTGARTNDVRVKLQAGASAAAIAADRRPASAITWHGRLGPQIAVTFKGRDGRQPPRPDAPATGSPRIVRQ